jgi:hypothetical protein
MTEGVATEEKETEELTRGEKETEELQREDKKAFLSIRREGQETREESLKEEVAEKEGQEIESPEGKGCDYRMFLRESDQIRRKGTPCFFECFCSHTEHHTRFFSAGQRLPPSDSLRPIR